MGTATNTQPGTPAADTAALAVPSAAAVPVLALDADTEDLLVAVEGFRTGLDVMILGARMLMAETATLTRDDTQSLLAALGGNADEQDFAAVFGALVARLTDPDTNPCLRELAPAKQANVQRVGSDVAVDIAHSLARDYMATLSGWVDPNYQDEDEQDDVVPAGGEVQ